MKRLFLSFVALALLAGSIAACGRKARCTCRTTKKAKKEHSKDRYGF